MTLVEAAPELGGQLRLAGLQPRRGQLLELIARYECQLEHLQLTVWPNAPLEVEEVKATGAAAAVTAPGSRPSAPVFQ